MRKLLPILSAVSLLISITTSAQKIVFTDEFNTKNVAFESAGGARIVEDSVTSEKVFIYSGKKEILFYHLDPKWKILHKLSTKPNKESQLSEPSFTVLKSSHDKDRWTFIVRSYQGFSKESVDFATGTHTVVSKFMSDMDPNYIEEIFIDGSDTYVLYLNKSNQLSLASFTGDLTVNNIKLDLNSSLPVGKSKKYTAEELYKQVAILDSFKVSRPYFTRRKVQFYVNKDNYAILISGEEPVAELNLYDKKTGKRTKSQLYSVQTLLPKGMEESRFNTGAIFFNNKVHVLAATKSGGVYAAFDPESKAVLYQYAYNEKENTVPFNYGPVTYETLPGAVNLNTVKEKVEDITLDKFCTEMFKHSCAITAKYMDDGKLLITLANYDMKQLAAATATMRNGLNTMTSSDWYVSTSAGLIFEPGAWQVSAKKTTWNEINNSNAGDSYKKVEPPASADAAAEYNDKRSYVLKTQFIGNRKYTIYFTASKELKIYEKILKFTPPKIFGLTD